MVYVLATPIGRARYHPRGQILSGKNYLVNLPVIYKVPVTCGNHVPSEFSWPDVREALKAATQDSDSRVTSMIMSSVTRETTCSCLAHTRGTESGYLRCRPEWWGLAGTKLKSGIDLWSLPMCRTSPWFIPRCVLDTGTFQAQYKLLKTYERLTRTFASLGYLLETSNRTQSAVTSWHETLFARLVFWWK